MEQASHDWEAEESERYEDYVLWRAELQQDYDLYWEENTDAVS